jgi:hypothetical protein
VVSVSYITISKLQPEETDATPATEFNCGRSIYRKENGEKKTVMKQRERRKR